MSDLWTQAAFELAEERARMQAELTARRDAAVSALVHLREQAAGARAQLIEFRDEVAAEREEAFQAAQAQAVFVDALLGSEDVIQGELRERDLARSQLRRSQRDEAWDLIAIALAIDATVGYRTQLPPPVPPAPPAAPTYAVPLTAFSSRFDASIWPEGMGEVVQAEFVDGFRRAVDLHNGVFMAPCRFLLPVCSVMLDNFEWQTGETIYGGVVSDQERASARNRILLTIGTFGVGAALGMAGSMAGKAPNNTSGWLRRPEGTRLKQVGNYWIKEVDPDASAIQRWWGQGSLNAQARALDKLGDMATPHLFKNGKLVMRDAGEFRGSAVDFLSIRAKASWRLGTPFNDIWPRNIGANGLLFDPALHPIHEGAWWTLGGVVVVGGGTWAFYEWQADE